MIELIDTAQEWRNVLGTIEHHDFYHTYDYHQLSKKAGERPLLMVYREGDALIALPFLHRDIKDSPYSDITSVYGYAGPISHDVPADFDTSKFVKAFETQLRELGVVSVFSRLHPYIDNQRRLLQGLGETPQLGNVVNIDLGQELDVQRAAYSKSTKNRTNKCRRISEIRKADNEKDIDTFIDIYYENMDRIGATGNYYFPREYFFDFFQCQDFDTDILLVEHNETGEAMAASMFVKTGKIVQFHLSGTRTDYLRWAPANVFLDEMRLRVTEEGYEVFNLGGGVGSKRDSLFDFKASFSNDYRDFHVWKYIVDEVAYEALSAKKLDPADKDFFPRYRA